MREERLLNLLQQKKGYFEAVLELTEEEEALEPQAWKAVLEQKKLLLSCIEEIDEELLHFKESLIMVSQEILEELDHISSIIKRILHLDVINQEKRKSQCTPHSEPLWFREDG